MKLIIGTYRGYRYLPDCLRTLDRNLTGDTERVFIDDSGDDRTATWLAQYGTVIEGGHQGFAHTMQLACEAMGGEDFAAFWEEDFTLDYPADLYDWQDYFDANPRLCQVALTRAPWFPHEIAANNVIATIPGIINQAGLWWQRHIFTTNPAIWSQRAWHWGWPQCAGSEVIKSRQLVNHDDLHFAMTEIEYTTHHGERWGKGY